MLVMKHGFGGLTDRFLRKAKNGKRAGDDNGRPGRGFPTPRRIRMALQELGPTFVKLGQLMSTRADIFPPEYIEEFEKLQDRVPPAPFADIRNLIEAQWGRPLLEVFSDFSPEPLAAASVAQVHLAETPNKERVAVKIIRPGIDRKIREDIRLMYHLAVKLEKKFEMARIIGLVDLVKEFERVIQKELDMFIEGGSIEKFRKNFRRSSEIYIPKVYWEYTTKSVLVMEHIDGVKMDRVDEIVSLGIDPKRLH